MNTTSPIASRAFARALSLSLLAPAIFTGCVVGDVESDDEFDQSADAIHANPNSSTSPATELNRATGRYPEVMYVRISTPTSVGSCTGTVIGPYAVMTANHCTGPGVTYSVDWGTDASLPATAVHLNPYLDAAYTPSWWVTLNNAQKAAGGRQDDWPAQHDQAILFVPGLTPAFLRDRRITPVAVQPSAGASSFTVVGVGSTGGANRLSMATRFLPSTANTITTWDRDGYLTRDLTTANYGNVDPGDSGGPSLGAFTWSWRNGQSFETGRYLVGTTQNNGASGVSPLAYDPGITMTTNQRLTVRVNALWAQARLDDPDGDGLPTACDQNPTAPNPVSDNLCPAPLGDAATTALATMPAAQLACKPGYAAVGLRGRSGDLIDRLAVQCRAFSCFGNADTACAGDAGREYWTEDFGGAGGGAFTAMCPNGSMMVGVGATHDPVSGLVHSLAPRCAPYSTTTSIGSATYEGPRAGNVGLGTSATRDCAAGKTMIGFQARTHATSFVTGLQPICTSDVTNHQWYMGGQGGGDASLRCPSGYRAFGTVQNARGGAVNAFGLLCGPSTKTGITTSDAESVVVHGGFMDYDVWLGVPAMSEPLSSAHLPTDATIRRCDGYLLGIDAHVDTLLWSVDSIRCSEGSTLQSYASKPVNIGTPTNGYYRGQRCSGFRAIDGLYVRSGWLTDGISIHCQ